MAEPEKRPTIHDVARHAGVSSATVSRVLNGKKWVGSETQAAVQRAIVRTGYTTNRSARSLAGGRSRSYAFLLTQPQRALFEDPNYAELIRGASEELSERDLAMVIMIADTPRERRQAVDYVGGGHIDGVLLLSPNEGDPLLVELEHTGVPLVCNGGVPRWSHRMSTVTADDHGGAVLAVDHLLACGAGTVATITGPDNSWGARERLRGYADVLAARGLPHAPDLVASGDWSPASGRAAMAALLDRRGDLDAVFVANDAMAAGALDALRAAGRRVPDDVLVVGFDDAAVAAQVDPPLTTVRLPLEQISREMVRLICAPEGGPSRVTLPTELVVRASAPAAHAPAGAEGR